MCALGIIFYLPNGTKRPYKNKMLIIRLLTLKCFKPPENLYLQFQNTEYKIHTNLFQRSFINFTHYA